MRGIVSIAATAVLVSCVACVSAGIGPSFDCEKASTPVEKAICSDAQLMQQDQQLAQLYKQAKIDKTEKAKQRLVATQRQWIKNRDRCAKSEPEHVVPCLQQQYKQRLGELSQARTISIDGDYHSLDQTQWIKQLGLSAMCSMEQSKYSKRFVKYMQLDAQKELLALGCNYWAYQGQYVVYLLTKTPRGAEAAPLRWIEPTYNETSKTWGAKEQFRLTGHTRFYKNSMELSVLRVFVGRGTCGSWTKYKVDKLSTTQSNKPHSVVADANCDTEIYQDQWPVLAVDSLTLE